MPRPRAGRARPLVALASCARYPDQLDEGALVLGALAGVGVEARTAVWSDTDVDWTGFDLVVANGAWDHIHRAAAFLAWVDRLTRSGVPLVNAPAVLRWNLDKRYLRDLEAAGVPTVPTVWIEPAEDDAELQPRVRLPGGEIVVKPAVSGGGFQTARYEAHAH